jgi:SAM-dependent methyltransferase
MTSSKLPFEDSGIDVIINDQVFEHVLNYPQAIEELCRVMRVGGVFLHIFPSRYRVIEPHIYVPLASIFRPRWWLWLWALLGVRNEFQHGLPAREVVEKNAHFLKYTRCFSQVASSGYFSCIAIVRGALAKVSFAA